MRKPKHRNDDLFRFGASAFVMISGSPGSGMQCCYGVCMIVATVLRRIPVIGKYLC